MDLLVLGLDGRAPVPSLRAARPDGSLAALPLAGGFDWRLGSGRSCVGRAEGGRHLPCPSGEILAAGAQCAPCSGLEDPACVFEPRCDLDSAGCHCATSFRGVPHTVYLALFGTLAKVGMTQAHRLDARLAEQGADAGFVVQGHVRGKPGEMLDRAAARSVERAVSFLHRIPEHRGHRETLAQLARPVPWERLEGRAGELLDALAGSFDVERRLRRVPAPSLVQPLPAVPRRVPSAGAHRGEWLGSKGPHLVYRDGARRDRLEAGPRLLALKAGDLAGRRLTAGDE